MVSPKWMEPAGVGMWWQPAGNVKPSIVGVSRKMRSIGVWLASWWSRSWVAARQAWVTKPAGWLISPPSPTITTAVIIYFLVPPIKTPTNDQSRGSLVGVVVWADYLLAAQRRSARVVFSQFLVAVIHNRLDDGDREH